MCALVLLLTLTLSHSFLYAQDSMTCKFEMHFNIMPSMHKGEAMDLMNDNHLAVLTNTRAVKLPPYKTTGGDSINKEILVYRSKEVGCFRGSNTMIELEFADDKLYKAYISTEYAKSAYQQMFENYNFLINLIKQKWPYEKGTKLTAHNIAGYGYKYTKTDQPTTKAETVLVQYVDLNTKSNTSNYLLEVLWANLKNTRMESTNY